MKGTTAVVLLMVICFISCRHTTEPATASNVVVLYSTSFEADQDTTGWRTSGFIGFTNDAPENGGTRCLEVNGGSSAPTAWIKLDTLKDSRTVTVAFWAHNTTTSSTWMRLISTTTVPYEGMDLYVQDTVWRHYSKAFEFPANSALRLQIITGGIVPGGVCIDLIEINAEAQ